MTQPEALRLAQWLERDGANCQQHVDAASELRRLHDDNENTLKHFNNAVEGYKKMAAQHDALLEALKNIDKEFRKNGRQHWPEAVKARAAIAKVEENT